MFWRQFTVICHGEIEYPEDDPVYGIWWTPHTLELDQCGLIEDAMSLADVHVSQHDFDLSDGIEALDFSPELVFIHDKNERLVLAGQASSSGIEWCPPVMSDDEVRRAINEVEDLRSEASYEADWDNFSTAKHLRLRALVLEGRLVDRLWREHASKVIHAVAN